MSSELPSVVGRMEMTHEAFQRACQVAIRDLQQEPQCQSHLVRIFCEAVRCSRECCEIATIRSDAAEFTTLRTRLAEVEESNRLLKEQVRVSDQAFNFHLKRANDLMNKCNEVEADAAVMRGLLLRSKDAIHEVAAFGNCDCDIPKGITCVPCECAMICNEIHAFLNPTNKDK